MLLRHGSRDFKAPSKKIKRSHTHTPTENNTPDTDTHAHDKNNTPNPQTNTSHKHKGPFPNRAPSFM